MALSAAYTLDGRGKTISTSPNDPVASSATVDVTGWSVNNVMSEPARPRRAELLASLDMSLSST